MPINLQKSIIGPKIKIEGNLISDEEIIIEGIVQGSRVDAGNQPVIVGLGGVVHADIYGGEIIIYGKVKGNCYGKKSITLGDKSEVIGDLYSPRIDIHPTAFVSGKLTKK
ncbi:MAG: polymer-forming cytoskeletal protein [Leptospiraceae bacterium]|nr:polymer-forming cytoskeletal protein [Leptospiraceae bacterium]MDW7976783.1 polymer-forming cytoskeletal protein [Leptospiraceae bacterium]